MQGKFKASYIRCQKVTNLYYIAVHSISLPSAYKIVVVRFIRKISPYSSAARCRSYYKSMPYRCVGPKWKFNVFVTTGRVFRIALTVLMLFVGLFYILLVFRFAVARLICRDYDWKQILQKHFFHVAILRTASHQANGRWNILQLGHVWRLHVHVQAALERCFNNATYRAPFFYFIFIFEASQFRATDRWWIEKWLSHKCLWMK